MDLHRIIIRCTVNQARMQSNHSKTRLKDLKHIFMKEVKEEILSTREAKSVAS